MSGESNQNEKITKEELEKHYCFEKVDRVSKDDLTTNFKRRARYQQALWREKNKFPIGSQPYKITDKYRPMGSRIKLSCAKQTMANFLTTTVKNAVINRLKNPEPKQLLKEDRLYANCLSSMPMCFNLFGLVSDDMEKATKAVKEWWPETPGNVVNVRFEWSPGRQIPGRFLENRSAFDSAFELRLQNGNKGLIGIETKYHEDCKREALPNKERIERYKSISDESGVFKSNYIDQILGTELQQIWQDHILALSMLQDEKSNWEWVKFVLVYPSKNPSFKNAATEYSKSLNDTISFEAKTIESLLSSTAIDKNDIQLFRERYIW
jgi:hypothetical protein